VPRIRSLHPGIFTDERYMALSFPARELIKGVWCEADDQGVFEWKPLTLKARILPADAVDMAALLNELIAGKFVTRIEIDDHSYGLVRNFRKYQRPKKPNSIYLLPPEFRTYVGLKPPTEELEANEPPSVPHQFPTEGGNPPQMEDGGWKREDEGEGKITPLVQKPQPVARARGAPAHYAFGGAVIRLAQADYDRWKASFSAIPDLRAELETIDAKLVDEGFEGKWFGRVSGWLRGRHEELLKRRNGEDEAYRGVI
jgi:hypothetical protein